MKRAHHLAVTRQAIAHLLDYPWPQWMPRRQAVSDAVEELRPDAATTALRRFLEQSETISQLDLQRHYVDVFDTRRRQTMYMTFYGDGDTRRRGHSLARVNEIYRTAGWRVDDGELPDYLPAILEFSARGDAAWGQCLLEEFQPGLQLLRAALHRCETPYAHLIDAVAATLPHLDRAARDRSLRLARTGPPTESVGLEGYPGQLAGGTP